MYFNAKFNIFILGLFILVAIVPVKTQAQLDLNKLSEQPSPKELQLSKNEYFEYLRKQILRNPNEVHTDVLVSYIQTKQLPQDLFMAFNGGEIVPSHEIIKAILVTEYQVKIPDNLDRACWGWGSTQLDRIVDERILAQLNLYYKNKHSLPDADDSHEKFNGEGIELLKRYFKECKAMMESELPKVMKFIENYNVFISQSYDEAFHKVVTEKTQKDNELKNKIDSIIKYAKINKESIERSSKAFCKEISGVWYADGDYFTVDMVASKIIAIKNNAPFHVQIGKYDNDKNFLIAYVTKEGVISIDENGKPFGLILRKVFFGGNEFKLGISMTDGIEVGQETILGWVRELK
jgi:hypothetical protein